MTGTPAATPAALAQAQAKAKQLQTQAKLRFTRMVQEGQKRLLLAEEELKRVEAARESLAQEAGQLGGFHHSNMVLLAHVHGALRRMMQLHVEAHRHNLALVSGEVLPDRPQYRVPEEEVPYQEARAFFDLTSGMFLWIQQAEGIDLVLRLTGAGQALVGATADEEAERAKLVADLQAQAAGDEALRRFVTGLGPELAQADQRLAWARAGMESLRQAKGPDAKAALLGDPGWLQLAKGVHLLGALSTKARAHPALAPHFPEVAVAELGLGQPLRLGGQLLGEA